MLPTMRVEIQVLSPPFPLSKANAKLGQQLQDRAAALARAREVHESDRNRLQTMDLSQMAADTNSFASAIYANHQASIDLLVKERTLRQELIEFYDACEPDLAQATERAFQAHEKAKAEIFSKLLAIGYLDGPLPGGHQPSIQPAFLMSHPDVRRSHATWDALRGMEILHDHRRLNREALREIELELDQVRRKLLGSA